MKKIFVIFYILLFASSSSGEQLVPVSADEQKDFNESVFIKAINEASNGKIPFPFENLIKTLNADIDDSNVLLVPNGRSLVKMEADYKNPRIIVAPFNTDAKTEALKKFGFDASELFIGFAPNTKSLEVISFNRKTSQFDFFLVENYEKGKTPRVVSNPALCISCHQNRAPIFPQLPWSEMTGHVSKETLKKDFLDVCDDPSYDNDLVNKIIAANPGRKSIEGINLEKYKARSVCETSNFDVSVTVASGLVEEQPFCEALCNPKDKVCMLNYLKLASGMDLSSEELLAFGNIDEKVAKISATPSHFIPNRDPYTDVGYRSLIKSDQITDDMPEFILKENFESFYDGTFKGVSNMFDKGALYAFASPVEDSTYVDPATPRPSSNTIDILKARLKLAKTQKEKVWALGNECIFNEIFISENGEPVSSRDIVNVINNPKVREALDSWPSTYALSRTIDSLINGKDSKDDDCLTKDPILAVYANKDLADVVFDIAKDKVDYPKALFHKYCSQCHNAETGFIVLPLASLDNMANYEPRFSGKAPLERVSSKSMPPASAPQPTEEERKVLVDVLKELKNHSDK